MAKIINILVIFGILLVSCTALSFKNGRIVGGTLAEANQYTHQVSIRKFGGHFCGGSIISDRWILTAAHCAALPPKLISVFVGSIYLNKNGIPHAIKRAIKHEKYDGSKYDIALIELVEPIKFTKSVTAIKLSHSEVPNDDKVIITGWGSAYNTGPVSNTLKYNDKLSKLDSNSCSTIMDTKYYDGIMCLQHSIGNGACGGDSGGPATYNGELVGVASFGMEACGTDKPDGYVDVSHFIDWINSKTDLKL